MVVFVRFRGAFATGWSTFFLIRRFCRPGFEGQRAKWARISTALRLAPHFQPQGIFGPGGLPGEGRRLINVINVGFPSRIIVH